MCRHVHTLLMYRQLYTPHANHLSTPIPTQSGRLKQRVSGRAAAMDVEPRKTLSLSLPFFSRSFTRSHTYQYNTGKFEKEPDLYYSSRLVCMHMYVYTHTHISTSYAYTHVYAHLSTLTRKHTCKHTDRHPLIAPSHQTVFRDTKTYSCLYPH